MKLGRDENLRIQRYLGSEVNDIYRYNLFFQPFQVMCTMNHHSLANKKITVCTAFKVLCGVEVGYLFWEYCEYLRCILRYPYHGLIGLERVRSLPITIIGLPPVNIILTEQRSAYLQTPIPVHRQNSSPRTQVWTLCHINMITNFVEMRAHSQVLKYNNLVGKGGCIKLIVMTL